MAHLGWLILPPRLSQKRRGRNGIAVKSSFLPKRRGAYRSLGVTADREIHPRDHPFFSPIFHSSVKRTIVTHHPIPATRTITFAIPRFLGTETKRSCREIRSEILLSCWYLLIARDRFALLISPNEIFTALVYFQFNIYIYIEKSFLKSFWLKNQYFWVYYWSNTFNSSIGLNIFHIWRDEVFHSPIDSMNSKGKWSRNEIRYLRIGKETKEQHYYLKT